jgi:hypothetical protein
MEHLISGKGPTEHILPPIIPGALAHVIYLCRFTTLHGEEYSDTLTIHHCRHN